MGSCMSLGSGEDTVHKPESGRCAAIPPLPWAMRESAGPSLDLSMPRSRELLDEHPAVGAVKTCKLKCFNASGADTPTSPVPRHIAEYGPSLDDTDLTRPLGFTRPYPTSGLYPTLPDL